MNNRNYGLECTEVSNGMLPGEKAIETMTVDGKKISLFVSESPEVFEPNRRLIRVDILDETSDAYLVYLPAPSLEVSSRFVNVPKGKVVEW